LIFGIFSFLSFLSALADSGRLNWAVARRLGRPGTIGGIISFIGGLFGFYVAGYTGVLLAVTNRPIWSDSPLLGMLFVISAASISAALMILLAERNHWTMPGIADLHRMDMWVLALEFIVLVAFLISLGPVFRAWFSVWGLVLLLGVVVLGLLVPIFLSWRRDRLGIRTYTASAALVLIGGFILRMAIVLGGEAV
jgi:formate-dependent nitrite reductase membrane component NrfD